MATSPLPLHRLLGLPPGRLTSDVLDQAIAAGLRETSDLDWKEKLPEQKTLKDSDFAKDVAAMANSGGGLIVYGIAEDRSTSGAVSRVDVGDVTDAYERTMRQVAAGLQPPVFGLKFIRLGNVGTRTLVLAIPASNEAPHLIYNKDFFGAPIRNGAHTDWMRERQIEQAYRLRHERRRRAEQELEELYAQTAVYARPEERLWFVGVARPSSDHPSGAVSREAARTRFRDAGWYALQHANEGGVHPLDSRNPVNPRIGLRRWIAPMNLGDGRMDAYREAWATVHEDGAVTLAAALGGGPDQARGEKLEADEIDSMRVEAFVADLFGLIRSSAMTHPGEFDLRISLETTERYSVRFIPRSWNGDFDKSRAREIRRFIPILATVPTEVSLGSLHEQVKEIVLDILNQGGIQDLLLIPDAPT